MLKNIYKLIYQKLPTFINCHRMGLKYNPTWIILGKGYVTKPTWFQKVFLHYKGGLIQIGNGFKCISNRKYNSIGLIQPCHFNIMNDDSSIIIGNNVGISGSSICASSKVIIGDNTIIGSGCIISDTDAHPVNHKERLLPDAYKYINSFPITIGQNVFIGARSIILKGVTIGDNAVIGAGSVVSKDVPANTIVVGNPAVVVKNIEQ